MKSGSYTTSLELELEFSLNNGDDIEYRYFNVSFTANWQNNGIGRYEYGSAVCFDKGVDYLEQITDWKIESDVTKEEEDVIKIYIEKNEEKILEQMAENYDPYWECSY